MMRWCSLFCLALLSLQATGTAAWAQARGLFTSAPQRSHSLIEKTKNPLVVRYAPQGSYSSVGNTKHPLVARYEINAPISGQLTVEFGKDTNYGRVTSSQTVNADDDVSILVAGMNPDTVYHMRARIDGNGQSWTDDDQTFTTGSLPQGSYAEVTVQGASQGGGVDLVSDLFSDIGALVLDNDGSILWYYYDPNTPHLSFPIRQVSNGDFMVQTNNDVREVDLEGQTVRDLTLDQLNAALTTAGYDFEAASFHHDVLRLDNGHWILLTNEYKWFYDLPGYPGWTQVLGDTIIDVAPDNSIAWVWRAFDHLDVNRHPWQFPPDWTHCNALVYTQDNNLLLSCRHQSWILKIQYLDGMGNGDVLWKFGYEGDFQLPLADPAQWFYDQHFPVVLNTNGSKITLLLYDNGDQRPDHGQQCYLINTCYSRGVIYNLDESNGSANVVWQYPLQYSFWGGSILQLPNGNIEIDSTTVNSGWAEVLEVTHDNPHPVWTMDSSNAYFYRAYRIPSLYPGVQW